MGSEMCIRDRPILIRQQNIAALEAIVNDASIDETRRIGAIEGLGRIRTNEAEACLQSLSQQQDIDTDIGRAAYRALRRSQRARHKASADNTTDTTQGAAA